MSQWSKPKSAAAITITTPKPAAPPKAKPMTLDELNELLRGISALEAKIEAMPKPGSLRSYSTEQLLAMRRNSPAKFQRIIDAEFGGTK
jgi:hypothetical protein